jgi:hypothetical protein
MAPLANVAILLRILSRDCILECHFHRVMSFFDALHTINISITCMITDDLFAIFGHSCHPLRRKPLAFEIGEERSASNSRGPSNLALLYFLTAPLEESIALS